MDKKRGRQQTFDLSMRQDFARLIRKHGVRGACAVSKIPVSPATMGKIAKEFKIRLSSGRRPLKACPIVLPQFTEEQVRQLHQVLEYGATASGYNSNHWTGRRISEVVQKLFGVKCHAVYLKPLLSRLGFRVVERTNLTVRSQSTGYRPSFAEESNARRDAA